MLSPFWGFGVKSEVREVYDSIIEHYMKEGADIFELTTLDDAQVAVLPFQWEQVVSESFAVRPDLDLYGKESDVAARVVTAAVRAAEDLAEEAASRGKPLVVFFFDDNETLAIPLRNAHTFRPSLVGARRSPREFAMPVWVNRDEVELTFGGVLPLREKGARPVIGFCGVPGPVPGGIRSHLRHRLAASPPAARAASRLGVELLPEHHNRARAQALYLISRAPRLRTNFIFRAQWFNGAFHSGVDTARLAQSRAEYLENMIGSDYILCARGVGNYSFRFYETLSCGRIPVLINTDCVLPYEKWIDWKRYCIWVEEEELPHIEDKIVEFHERHSPSEFQDLQRECRQLWLEWLSPQGFFKNFYRHFE